MEKQLIYSAIKCPDGVVLESKHVHDCVQHLDKNGETYVLDGGTDYIRRSINKEEAEDLSLYSDSPHEQIREVVSRGGHGIDGTEPLRYVLLKDIPNDWLQAIIDYEELHRPGNFYIQYYKLEQNFRKNEK